MNLCPYDLTAHIAQSARENLVEERIENLNQPAPSPMETYTISDVAARVRLTHDGFLAHEEDRSLLSRLLERDGVPTGQVVQRIVNEAGKRTKPVFIALVKVGPLDQRRTVIAFLSDTCAEDMADACIKDALPVTLPQ